jgi:hypothetical protein
MELWDFNRCCEVARDDDRLARLRSVRRGPDGAFILSRGGEESLWVHFHGDAAFLWFVPGRDDKYPGFVPQGMWPGERRDVSFLHTTGAQPIQSSCHGGSWSRRKPVTRPRWNTRTRRRRTRRYPRLSFELGPVYHCDAAARLRRAAELFFS